MGRVAGVTGCRRMCHVSRCKGRGKERPGGPRFWSAGSFPVGAIRGVEGEFGTRLSPRVAVVEFSIGCGGWVSPVRVMACYCRLCFAGLGGGLVVMTGWDRLRYSLVMVGLWLLIYVAGVGVASAVFSVAHPPYRVGQVVVVWLVLTFWLPWVGVAVDRHPPYPCCVGCTLG